MDPDLARRILATLDTLETRPALEVQRAHDLLVGIILLPGPAKPPPDMIAAADVLCWVLKHDHNKTFAGNLVALETFMHSAGYSLEELPKEGS